MGTAVNADSFFRRRHNSLNRVRENMSGSDAGGMWFVGRNRMAGSSTVYWGPFASLQAIEEWIERRQIHFTVFVVRMNDPESSEEDWWI